MAEALPPLVSPEDGSPLRPVPGGLAAADGTVYPITDGIADLVNPRLLDRDAAQEIEVFDHLWEGGVCYFRPKLFDQVLDRLLSALPPPGPLVEIGGGEGYLAAAYRARTGQPAYVADLSWRALARAGLGLGRIRCDARRPYLAPASVSVAAFWVSLHHFPAVDRRAALATAIAALAPGGILVVFEPSRAFLPRRLFLATPLRRLVYFEEEDALDPVAVERDLAELGCTRLSLEGLNPPYAPAFLRRLRLWPLLVAATEAFHLIDRLRPKDKPLAWGSYCLGLYRKPL